MFKSYSHSKIIFLELNIEYKINLHCLHIQNYGRVLKKKLKRKTKITKERSLSFSASLYEDINWDTKLAM